MRNCRVIRLFRGLTLATLGPPGTRARLCRRRHQVVKRYEGLGEVAFIRRASDGLWVRANRPGMMLLELIMDRVEAGAFTYRVSHENGVVVRTAPGLDAPIERVRHGMAWDDMSYCTNFFMWF